MIMKSLSLFSASLASVALLSGCDIGVLDNYDEPTSTLTGQVIYEGTPVGVRSNGVQLELWQPGYALSQKIPVYVNQDGTFSAVLFDGTYKLNLLPGNGPWVDIRDTIPIELKGKATVAVPVVPYYTIKNETIRHSNGAIEATFSVGQVNTSRAVEYVGLYGATTSFVDRTNMDFRTEKVRSAIASLSDPINLSVTLPATLAHKKEVFVRIGVKTLGVSELLFSPVYKIAI